MTQLSEIVRSRELLVNLTLRDLRGRYRRSALGWAWSLVNPLSTLLIYAMVFRAILRVPVLGGDPSGLSNFPLYLLSGLVFWNFFATGVGGSMGMVLGNANLVKKVYFPRAVLVVANVASAAVTLLIELGVLSVAFLVAGNNVLFWLPVVLLLVAVQAAFVVGLGLVASAVNVYFRDLEYLVGIALQLLFFAAPIVYPVLLVPRTVHVLGVGVPFGFLYNVNPIVRFVQAYRDCLYDLRFPPLVEVAYLVGVAAVTLGVGLAVFGRLEGRLAEEL